MVLRIHASMFMSDTYFYFSFGNYIFAGFGLKIVLTSFYLMSWEMFLFLYYLKVFQTVLSVLKYLVEFPVKPSGSELSLWGCFKLQIHFLKIDIWVFRSSIYFSISFSNLCL